MNEPTEAMVVTPRSPERTAKIPPHRPYKPYPRRSGEEQEREPTTAPSSNKAADDPVNFHYRQNFGKDGIYVPPVTNATRHGKKYNTDKNNNGNGDEGNHFSRTSARRMEDELGGVVRSEPPIVASFRVSSPQAVPVMVVDDDRGAENDIPFDQASDDAQRERSAVSDDMPDEKHGRHRYSINDNIKYENQSTLAPSSGVSSPLRNPRVSDLEDSCSSPVSTKFSSIWLSSPEGTPDRNLSMKAPLQQRTVIPPRQQLQQQHQERVKEDVGLGETFVQDELDESDGRFTFPPPKLSSPNPVHESLIKNPQISTVPEQTALQQRDVIADEVNGLGANNAKKLAVHRIHSYKERTGVTHKKNLKNCSNEAITTVGLVSTSCQDWVRKAYEESGPVCGAPGSVLPPPSGVDDSGHHDDNDSIFDFVVDQEESRVVQLGGEEEPDNLYKNVRVTHKVRRRTRQRRKQQHQPEEGPNDVDDDTSTENYGATPVPPTSLQERAHQAWKSRQQKKNSSLRSKQDGDPKSKGANVWFGAPNTVHHFQPEPQVHQTIEEEDLTSLDRSLNSEYTKTLESEVEDMIKDILLIGSSKVSKPGRRKIKNSPEIRQKMKKRATSAGVASGNLGTLHENKLESLEDDPSDLPPVFEPRFEIKNDTQGKKAKTREPSIDSTYSTESNRSHSRSLSMGDDRSAASSRVSSVDTNTVATVQSERDTSDPLNAVIGFVEDGLTVMSSAIGFAIGAEPSHENESRGRQFDRKRGTSDHFQSSIEGLNIFDSCTGRQSGVSSEHPALADVVGMLAQDLWFGPTLETSDSGNQPLRSMDSGESYGVVTNRTRSFDLQQCRREEKETGQNRLDLGSESDLDNLAVHAAHSVHKLQGVEFDESVSIDKYKDLKISWVQLKLPLGIIFLENEGGCFVTKVSPDGSAARSRGVEVGDQLASINGISSIKMKVDDICDVIANSKDPSQVELVFLRYIGPFRPSRTLPSGSGYRLESDGSLASTAKTSKSGMSMWRKTPAKKNNNGGFRLFGRGKNKVVKEENIRASVKR